MRSLTSCSGSVGGRAWSRTTTVRVVRDRASDSRIMASRGSRPQRGGCDSAWSWWFKRPAPQLDQALADPAFGITFYRNPVPQRSGRR